MKPSYNPSGRRRKRTHGFLKRMSKRTGKKIISSRRRKGRKKLTV